jgi:NAD-dependent dihydropyrimidine dehydrogenase PreA subunit/nitroreductase
MNDQRHWIDPDTCKGDGICVEVCPEDVFHIVDDKSSVIAERRDACILCGQCVAVCPNDSIRMPELPSEGFERLRGIPFGYPDFMDFLKSRRSVRVFKDRPVDKELADKIVAAAATAPMGFPPHSTKVLVIDRREEMKHLLEETVKSYEGMVKGFSSPIGRLFIRLAAGGENYGFMKDCILDVARYANEAYRRDGADHYLYNAPMLMLFLGDSRAVSYVENAYIVCQYAMLAALSLGLGSTVIGLVPPIVDRSKTLRKRFNISDKDRVITSLVLGHPKYKYQKSIRRELAGVHTA